MILDLKKLKFNPNYYTEIYPNIWLMDNHKWAWYIWEKYRRDNNRQIPSILVHIDKHWDPSNDFHTDEQQEHLRDMSLETIYGLTKKDSYDKENEPNILMNNYIAPAVNRGLVREIHFYCKQKLSEPDAEPGLDQKILDRNKAKQFVHKRIDALTKSIGSKTTILNIDLDLFNNSEDRDKGILWTDSEIYRFLDKCEQIIRNASLITIAMSFGFSGSEDDTRHLVNLVCPRIIDFR